MQSFSGVLFDFDGVIGDTMHDNYIAWTHALGLFGASATKEEYFLVEGERVSDIASILLKRCGKDPANGQKVAIEKDTYYKSHNTFRFSTGIPEFVDSLINNKTPVGCVSGGSRMRLLTPETSLLLSKFQAIVTADDVTKGKPNPEPFLKGAAKLGLDPNECIVIENAPLGVKSAKAAGMFCIAVTTTLKAEHLSEADLILPSTENLLGTFEFASPKIIFKT